MWKIPYKTWLFFKTFICWCVAEINVNDIENQTWFGLPIIYSHGFASNFQISNEWCTVILVNINIWE